jgi:CBS-domain-containing membrane protein
MKLLRKITVREAYNLDKTPSLIAQPEDDFTDVVRRFAEEPDLRGIFIAEADCHLLGVITRRDLLDWARIQLGASFYSSDEHWLKEDVRLFELMRASKAREVARPDSSDAAVRLDDPLSEALRKMLVLDLSCLPVIDEDDIIIGDLKLSEILQQVLHSTED